MGVLGDRGECRRICILHRGMISAVSLRIGWLVFSDLFVKCVRKRVMFGGLDAWLIVSFFRVGLTRVRIGAV